MTDPNLKHLLLAIILALNLGCGGAEAMARKPAGPAPNPPPVGHNTPSPATDRYRLGLQLGTQNGERMIVQIKRATVGTQGCDGRPAFERALVAVTKAIRPPRPGPGEDLDLARGYFRGYATTFGKALYEALRECEIPTVVEGELPGTVVGSLLCGAGSIDVQLLDIVEIEPIYTGWSGGKPESKTECGKVAVRITSDCAIGNEVDREKVEKILENQIALGCSD